MSEQMIIVLITVWKYICRQENFIDGVKSMKQLINIICSLTNFEFHFVDVDVYVCTYTSPFLNILFSLFHPQFKYIYIYKLQRHIHQCKYIYKYELGFFTIVKAQCLSQSPQLIHALSSLVFNPFFSRHFLQAKTNGKIYFRRKK